MTLYPIDAALVQVQRELGIDNPDPWDIVALFESKIATFCGAKYAVALDSCTNALFLSLKFKDISNQILSIPKHTYLSVPQVLLHSGNKPAFVDIEWTGAYEIGTTGIIDSAGRVKESMYISNSLTCISFHRKKPIPIGKGRMILTDDFVAYQWFQKAVYEGRDRRIPHDSINDISILGWNMYMTPEMAAYGLSLLDDYFLSSQADTTSSQKYNDISRYTCFDI